MKDDPTRIASGEEGLRNLADFTRRILAVPKSGIAEKVQAPIYRARKHKRRRRPVPK